MTAGGRPLRLVLIDDHALFRNGLKLALEADGTMQVVAEATTVEEALCLVASGPECDAVLVDYELSRGGESGSGITVVKALRAAQPHAPILVVTGGMPQPLLAQCRAELHASVFFKSEPLPELIHAIRRTAAGEQVMLPLSDASTDATEGEAFLPSITFSARERLVLRLITEGLANKEIADLAGVSESNVKAIIQRIFLKTGVRSRSQLVRYVFEFNVDLL